MRWKDYKQRWVRPLHSILCVFDGETVDQVAFGDFPGGDMSLGHRFLSAGPITNVKDFRCGCTFDICNVKTNIFECKFFDRV